MTKRDKEDLKTLQKTVRILRREFGRCKSFSPGCASCVVGGIISKLEWIIGLYKYQ